MADEDRNSRLAEVERILARMAKNAEKEEKKNNRRAKENEKRAAENERMIEELRESSKSVDRQLKRLGRQLGGEGNRWGKVVEDLVAGDLIAIAREVIGVNIDYVSTRTYPEDRSWEIDVLGTNHEVVVAVEVKTRLSQKDIDKFLAKTLLPFTRSTCKKRPRKRVFGVIAYVKVASQEKESEVINYA